jgi:predicted Ser/Thr protein kinase
MSGLPRADEARARRIGRYLITGRIGKGGMGMVYRGLDEGLEREVAVKTLTAEGAFDADSRRRFAVEARAAGRLQHPNIVIVYELGEDRGLPFIAMELLPGTDLEALLRSGEELLLAEKLEVVIQACRGLAYAHERGIVHRDMKPSNIRILDDGTAKILDFGIAKLGGTHLTRTGMIVGTVHYMSPEQVRGGPLDGRSDVFSLGVILYELLAGERPFRGEGPTQVLYKIVAEPAPPLDPSKLGDVGPRLQAVVDRALAKNREERYPRADDLADELQAALDEHLRASEEGPVPAERLARARRAVREGRLDEGVEELQAITTAHPGSVDARRELRAALRERGRRARPPSAEPEGFPELESTFQASPTRREPETALQPTVTVPPSGGAPSRLRRRQAMVAGGAVLLVAAVGTLLVLRGRPAAPPVPADLRIPVRSQPLGARVLVDGRDSGTVTNGELVLPSPAPKEIVLTFRKDGHRDESRTVRLPLPPGQAVSVTLQTDRAPVTVRTTPSGAAVTLDGQRVAGLTPLELALEPGAEHVIGLSLEGYRPREIRVGSDEAPQAVAVDLAPLPPPGRVAISSSYPLDVQWRGQVLARGELAPHVELPSGRQVLTLVSATVFLRADVSVEVPPAGEAAVEAPALGRINVRALPDNCRVLVDGAFVDYPPILDRGIAAGPHTVSFEWPDGATRDQAVTVEAGASAFVTGRKE